MSDNQKDTVYIDVDDEITSIIDKVHGAKQRIVALVLPKRATMLQSSVNMKLLKKTADSTHKQIVLITTESSLLPLAGSVGLYVAKNLQSKPEVPEAAVAAEPLDELAVDESEQPEDFDSKKDGGKAVGELAGLSAAEEASKTSKAKPELTPRPIPRAGTVDEAIELDNTESAQEAEADKAKTKAPKNKKLKVPNFERFRLRVILAAVLLIILIVGFILANIILPHATIDVATNTSNVNSSLTLNLSTSAATLNPTSLTVPAHLQQTQQTQNQTVNTTGQKNEGQSATGSVVINESTNFGFPNGCQQPTSIPSGTGISDQSNTTFILNHTVTFSNNPTQSGNQCIYASNKAQVTAQNPGSLGNSLPSSGATFTVSDSSVTASGTASGNFTDGTNNIVQVVSQTDITTAEQKMSAADASSIKTALQQALQQAGYYAIPASFNAGTPSTSTSANVGDQASSVTVTQTTAYTMFGVHKSDLQTLLDNSINSQINAAKQSIQNDGVNGANFSVLSQSTTAAQITMQATAIVGPKLDIASLKTQIAGKKTGDVKSIIGGNPGVTNVTVHLSPFWVGSVPKSTTKITINLTKSNGGQ